MKWNGRSALSFCAIVLGFFMALLDSTIVNIALPEMMHSYSSSVREISWVMNGYNLAFAVFILTSARLADQFGRKKLFLIGLAVFTLSSLFAGLSTSSEALIACRVVQGLAGAIIVPVTVPLTTSTFPKELHGVVIGIWGAVSGLAAASGPALGGILIDWLSWPWIFFVNVPLGILSIVLTVAFIQESVDPSSDKRIDWAGMLSISAAMFCLTYAFIKVPDYGWGSPTTLFLFGVSLLAFFCFALAESKGKHPMLPLSLLRIGVFNRAAATLIVAGGAIMSVAFLMSFFLTRIVGMSELHAGLTISVMALASMCTSVFSGPLSAKYGSRWFAAAGMLLMILSIYTFRSLTSDSSTIVIMLRLALSGLGLGLCLSPVIAASVRNVPEEKVGIASGVVNMARAIGNVLGVAILATVLNNAMTSEMDHAKEVSLTHLQSVQELAPEWKQVVGTRIEQTLVSDNGNSTSSINSFKPAELSALLDQQKEAITKTLSDEQREAFLKEYDQQKKMVTDQFLFLQSRLQKAGENAFHHTFGFSCLILLIGVPLALGSDVRYRTRKKLLKSANASADHP
ncbi:MFS transporter [Gorillibacterium timonense]|uniref:MFS transporter n=1 Tax=Gorillibacterium timonense TaxID=1689269 RepID=UPI00071D90AB|nr:MFS transporter [Gorillibacterium timonense]